MLIHVWVGSACRLRCSVKHQTARSIALHDIGWFCRFTFGLEGIGNELIIPGRETAGTDNGLPVVCSETVKSGGCRGVTEN